jgi:hypothetical protein
MGTPWRPQPSDWRVSVIESTLALLFLFLSFVQLTTLIKENAYSHSRLSFYEQYLQKFKLQYIDKVETEAEKTVEAVLGSRIHETLEKFY